MRRKTWVLAAAVVLVAAAAAGGVVAMSGAEQATPAAQEPPVGSTPAYSNTGTGGNKNVTDRDEAVKFAECMRANGVGAFPDPHASGEFPTTGISVSHAVWDKALRACKDLQPPGSVSAKRTPEQQSEALKFAQCMRENGVKDFPDPANGERLVDMTRIRSQIPSSGTPGGMSILHAAMQKCAVTSWERQWGG
jgi:hypothetical protein